MGLPSRRLSTVRATTPLARVARRALFAAMLGGPIVLAGGLVGCKASGGASGGAKAAASDPAKDLDALVSLMAGSFSSQEQSKADPEFFDIRLHMTRIWPERKDGRWLYVEQATAQALDKPYRERVYRVSAEAGKSGAFVSEVFMLPGVPLAYAGAWKDTNKLVGITPEQLTLKSGCTVYLARQPDGTYTGGTRGDGCASDLRGASYATSEVTITSAGLKTWDRGYDKDKKQVWGAVKGGYEFKRVQEK